MYDEEGAGEGDAAQVRVDQVASRVVSPAPPPARSSKGPPERADYQALD